MTAPVVADTGPLIRLARIGRLDLLRDLYGQVVIPPVVADELQLAADRPGARALREAVAAGWLRIESATPEAPASATSSLDPCEAAAIALAASLSARFLLIDDARGRAAAQHLGLTVVGAPGVLLAAKRHGLLAEVRPVLEQLAIAGYRLSTELRSRLLELAGESSLATVRP